MRKVWTYETCREEALKYKLRTEFMKNCPGAYNFARTNRWLDKFFDKPPVKKSAWTESSCREEAKKYMTRTEFKKGCASAYAQASKLGWLKEYDWFVHPEPHNKKWTYETCMEEARKYKSITEFHKGCNRAYAVARQNNWMKEYVWFACTRRQEKRN